MSNNQTTQDLKHELYRPKRLYITSEDVSDFDDAGSCRFILKEPIVPAEGFKLVYGLHSFGYVATAYNISTVQKNNMLCFMLEYYTPQKQFTNGAWINSTPIQKRCYQKLVIPDGYYGTLSQLFSVMNNLQLTHIKSGLLKDVTKTSVTDPNSFNTMPSERFTLSDVNEIPFIILWSETEYGFQIDLSLPDDVEILNDYYNFTDASHIQAFEANIQLGALAIIPGDSDTQNLYNLLFTNQNDKENKGINITTAIPLNNVNPPPLIIFQINCPLSYDEGSTNPVDTVSPMDDFKYFVLTDDQSRQALGKLLAENPFDGSHETIESAAVTNTFILYANVPFKSFYPPRLYPLYVELATNLETQNLTVDGYFANLLCRSFPVNADQGAASFFQQWDQPVMHHARSSRNAFDSIKIDFKSESDKWSFFNLTFFIELVFYETAEEEEMPQYQEQFFQVPEADPMTTQLQQFSKSFSNPFPVHPANQNSGNLRVGSLRSKRQKSTR